MVLLAQIEHADDAWKIGTEYGILGVLVIGGALCLVAAGMYIVRRLLNPKDGVVTTMANNVTTMSASMVETNDRNSLTLERNSEVLMQLKDNAQLQQGLCESHAEAMVSLDKTTSELIALHKDPHSQFSTAHLTSAALAACDVLDRALPASKEQIEQVRRKLRGD